MEIRSFYSENVKGRDILRDLGVDRRIILIWTGLIWLRIGSSSGLL
jgi:hypothetical protein